MRRRPSEPPSPSASRSTSASSRSRRSTASSATRWRCWPTPGHNLSDVLGLVVAWGAARWPSGPQRALHLRPAGRPPSWPRWSMRCFCWSRSAASPGRPCGASSIPQPVAGMTVMVVAAVGIVVNGVTAWLFARGRKGDINIRGAFLHMAADAAVSAGVVVAGRHPSDRLDGLDPAVSLVIVAGHRVEHLGPSPRRAHDDARCRAIGHRYGRGASYLAGAPGRGRCTTFTSGR